MKRDLKFRAFNFVANKMYYEEKAGDVFKWQNEGQIQVIMQYINSTDRNGIDVYDGDILEAPSGNLFVVRWYDEEMRWAMNSMNTWYNLNMGLHTVVGNIHENLDLIGK